MNKKVLSLFLSLIVSFFLTIKFNLDSLISILVIAVSYLCINNSIKKNNKKYNRISIVLSIVFSVIYVICDSIEKSYTIDIFNRYLLLNLSGYSILFYLIFLNIFKFIDKYRKTTEEDQKIYIGSREIMTDNKFSFFINFGFIFIIQLIFLLRLYPGNLTYDSFNELSQVLGNLPLMDNHSILHTGILALFIKFGLLFKSINLGIFLYSLVQITLVSLVFSYILHFLTKQKVPMVFRIVSLFFFAFHPINIIYSFTLWKDIFFSLSFVILTIQIFNMINDNDYFMNKKNIILFILNTIIFMYLRHNGPIIIVISFIILFILYRKKINRLLPILLSIVIVFFCSKLIILNTLNIKSVNVGEALSFPSQSIARIYKNGNISDKEKAQIEKFYSNEIGNVYNPIISDNAKGLLNNKYFKKHKKEYFKLNIDLFKKHSKEYLESLISNSYGYYYINTNYSALIIQDTNLFGVEHKIVLGDLAIYLLMVLLLTIIMLIVLWNLKDKKNILLPILLLPILFVLSKNTSLIYVFMNIGIYILITFILFIYNIKNKKNIVYYIPTIISWMIILLSPVYSEFRYLYSLFILIPLFIGLTFKKDM